MAQEDIRKAAGAAADKVSRAADDAADTVRDKAHGMRDKLDEAVDRGAEAVDEARRRGAEALDAARQGASDMAANVRDEAGRLYRKGERRAAQFADHAASEAEDYYDEVSEMVRRQPATALGIAAGIGFLVGILIARR